MKTKEELNAIKEEVEAVNKKLAQLSEDELAQVTGGVVPGLDGRPGIVPPIVEPPVIELPVRLDHDPWEVSERPSLRNLEQKARGADGG